MNKGGRFNGLPFFMGGVKQEYAAALRGEIMFAPCPIFLKIAYPV